MKYIKLFESIDVDDFNMIFQDIKDDFPEIKWTFNREIEEILSGFDKSSGDLGAYGMDVYDFRTSQYKYDENLLGYSNTIRYNPHNRLTNGIKTWYTEIRSLSNKLNPYFYEVKNRLKDKGLDVNFSTRKGGISYGLFYFAITYKKINNKKFEGLSGDILGIKQKDERESINIEDFVDTLRKFEDRNDYIRVFLSRYDNPQTHEDAIVDYLPEFHSRGQEEDWEFEFVENVYEKGDGYEEYDFAGIYKRKEDGKYFKYNLGYDGDTYIIPDHLYETRPRYITKTLWI